MGNCPSYWSVLHFNIKGSETLSLQSFFASLGMQRKNVLVLKSFFFPREPMIFYQATHVESVHSFLHFTFQSSTVLSFICSKLL